jgi:hypothetical protein
MRRGHEPCQVTFATDLTKHVEPSLRCSLLDQVHDRGLSAAHGTSCDTVERSATAHIGPQTPRADVRHNTLCHCRRRHHDDSLIAAVVLYYHTRNIVACLHQGHTPPSWSPNRHTREWCMTSKPWLTHGQQRSCWVTSTSSSCDDRGCKLRGLEQGRTDDPGGTFARACASQP